MRIPSFELVKLSRVDVVLNAGHTMCDPGETAVPFFGWITDEQRPLCLNIELRIVLEF